MEKTDRLAYLARLRTLVAEMEADLGQSDLKGERKEDILGCR